MPEAVLDDSARAMLDGVFAFQQGPGHMLLEYMVPGQDESTAPGARRWNWIWYRKVAHGEELERLMTDEQGKRHSYSLPPGAVKESDYQALCSDAKEMAAPTFQKLLEATEEPFVQAILDLQVPQMVFNRVILTGDAAFVPRPHTAGSTAKAAANARLLAQELARSGEDINAGLRRWESRSLKPAHR